MERLQIVKISPTENMTVLVETPVPGARHAEIAEKLMAYGGVNCEQVGYIEPPRDPAARARLQMMGGDQFAVAFALFTAGNFCDPMIDDELFTFGKTPDFILLVGRMLFFRADT